ncbi:helix-turn-helix transcriptional regulator [Vibrio vulnificus]|uniref:helix-turn-helix transcriptional regulator n=1 Tax=Vibrionaceae TaxID=641 RepID=UPI000C2B3225|nr:MULTISPECIES: helix-turn-helix domain-containing protein [Vibrionaceae]EGR3149408.1 AlpA family phage regulatory protein [Vibrio parahaemolyticus]EGR3163036.1 AlpA family phage regulatory protein [Vibrio parahaemolyticus]EJG0319455.1 AlpA family phage regulatory protein [Vibrio parahaemolyticus]EJG0430584.1 AlpA family phage regulatory protein [Vibrio parahaemolyticus]EKK9993130.1 AlpA family phage regulatory protein [Vibrio parahaemolyticus]
MTAQKQSNQLLSYQEVCKLTQLSQATIRRYVKSGSFPSPVNLSPGSRAVRFRVEDVQKWLLSL